MRFYSMIHTNDAQFICKKRQIELNSLEHETSISYPLFLYAYRLIELADSCILKDCFFFPFFEFEFEAG